MNIKTSFTIFVLLMYLLVGCDLQGTPPPVASTTGAIASLAPGAAMNTPMGNADSENLKKIIFSPCITIDPKLLSGKQLPRNLLVKHGDIPYVLDLETGIRTEELVPRSELAPEYYVSPDGKWLAYENASDTQDRLIVEPASNILTNSQKERILWSPHQRFFHLEGWLGRDTLALVIERTTKPTIFLPTLILNPFTREEHEYTLEDFPNYLDYQPGMTGALLFAHSNLMPDPTLTRLVYPSFIDLRLNATLWNLEDDKTIVSLPVFLDAFFNDPLWSLDGNDFLIMGVSGGTIEWIQVTRNGTIRQLTSFGDFLKDAVFTKPSRSWDGRYLAFQLQYSNNTVLKYLVLDLKSPTLQGFCVEAVPSVGGPLQEPVWSPDSSYLVISNVNENAFGDLILVDVEKREAFQIGKDVYARGWMVKP